MSRGSQSVGSETTEASDSSSGGRVASTGRSVGSTPSSTWPTRTQNRMPSSYAAKVRQAGWSPSSGIPCHRHSTVPSTTSQASSRAPRWGQAPGPAWAEPSLPRQSTTSRPATVRSRVRPVGTSAEAAATSQPWVGRRSAARQGGLDAGRLGVAPGATQVVGGRLGQVAHGHAVAHLFTPGPVGAEQAHDPTLPLRVRGFQNLRQSRDGRARPRHHRPPGRRRPGIASRNRPIGRSRDGCRSLSEPRRRCRRARPAAGARRRTRRGRRARAPAAGTRCSAGPPRR